MNSGFGYYSVSNQLNLKVSQICETQNTLIKINNISKTTVIFWKVSLKLLKIYLNALLGIGFAISFFFISEGVAKLFLYNHIGKYFKFETKKAAILSITKKPKDFLVVVYEYEVNDHTYQEKLRTGGHRFRRNIGRNLEIDNVNICYNTSFPSLNYIQGLKKENEPYGAIWLGIITMGVMLFFLFGVNHEKWILVYTRRHSKDNR